MSTNDTRFQNLRRKLDQFKYTQTLHPDSVELVDRLLKDNLKTVSELDKERKKAQYNHSSMHNPSLSMMEDQIDRLMTQNKELRAQLDNSKIGRQPDERTMKLQKHVLELKAKLQSKITEYTSQIDGLEDQVEKLNRDNSQLRKQRDQFCLNVAQSQQDLQNEKGELQTLLEKKRRQLKEAEESNGKYRIRVQVLEKSLEEAQNSVNQSQQNSRAHDSRLVAVLKQQLAEAQNRTRQAKDQVHNLTADSDSLKRQLRRMKEQLLSLQSSELKSQNYEEIDKVTRERYEQLIEETRQKLSQKCEEMCELREMLGKEEQQRSKLNNKMKEMANRSKFISDKNNDLQAEIQMVSGKLTMQVKRVRELQTINVTLEDQLKRLKDSEDGNDINMIQDKLREEESMSKNLRTEVALKEREISCLGQQLGLLRKEVEQRAIETDRVNNQNRRLQMIINQGSKNLDALQIQKEELMRQNRELKTGRQQLTSADYQAKSELFILKEQLQSSEVQLEELRGAVKHAQAYSNQLETEVKKLEDEVGIGEEKRRELFDDNQLMVGQIRVLEQRKNQLYQKVKHLQEKDQVSTGEKVLSRQQVDKLLSECEQMKRTVAKKDQHIRQMDMDRDELQNELDNETQRRKKCEDELTILKRQAEYYDREFDQQENERIDLEKKIGRLQTEKEELDRDLHRQCEEVIALRDRLVHLESENKSHLNEVNILTMANKESEREVERSRNRLTQFDRRLKDTQRSYQEERERATATGILQAQLQNQLQKERVQVMRLQGFVEQLEAANNEMYQQLEDKDHEIDHMNNSIYESKRAEEQLIRQISSYQRSVEELNADLEDSRNELRRLGGDRQALRAERDWKKDINMQSQTTRLRQEERYMNLQQDFERKTMDNDQLKQRNRQLQALLNEERTKNFRMSQGEGVGKGMLIESRVESYVQNQNVNYSNSSSRSRKTTSGYGVDDMSERSQPESVQSAVEKFRRIQEMYKETLPKC